MNIIEALQSERPLRRPLVKFMGSEGDVWIGHNFMKKFLLAGPYISGSHLSVTVRPSYALDESDLLANDWEIQTDWRDEVTIIE